MKTNGNDQGNQPPVGDDTFFDEDTDQLPILVIDETESGSEAQAASYANEMEAELRELEERWQSLDGELRRSEERAGKLRGELQQKDQTIADQQEQIIQYRKRIDELNQAVTASGSTVDELNKLRGEAAILNDRLQAALQERDELSRSIAEQTRRSIEVKTRSETIDSTNLRLANRVQDLEGYIEGRRDKWNALNNKLETREARIGELESVRAAGEKRINEREAEIKVLAGQIVELERSRSEAEGRYKERDSAYREMQSQLAGQSAEIERLRIFAEESDNDAMMRALAERDETIKALQAELAISGALRSRIESQNDADREQIGEFQREVAELRFERDRLLEQQAEAASRVDSLEQELADSKAATVELKGRLAKFKSRMAGLEHDVAAKAEVIDAFDWSATRIASLPASEDAISKGDDDAQAQAQTQGRMLVPLGEEATVQSGYSLSNVEVTIGRSKNSDIRILDNVVSRLHARIATENDTTIIEDLGSKNGVFVNSHRIDRAVLHHGDVLSVGNNHDFCYLEKSDAEH